MKAPKKAPNVVDQIWDEMQYEKVLLNKCQAKNLAIANGTYRMPWWTLPLTKRVQHIMNGLPQAQHNRWIFE